MDDSFSAVIEINRTGWHYTGNYDPIENYLDNSPLLKEFKIDTPIQFQIIYHRIKDIYGGDWLGGFESSEQLYPTPTVHLTLYDIFHHNVDKLPPPKRYCKIIDSNIWNYYVPLETARDADWKYDDNYALFTRIIKEIAHNTKKGLYNLSVTHEHADLNARLAKQSYLSGSHKAISPFLFHSENEMKGKIDDFENEENHEVTIKTIRKYKWRVLLLDDKCIEPMSKDESSNTTVYINKLQIIANSISRILQFDEDKIWFRQFHFKENNFEGSLNDFDKDSYGNIKTYRRKGDSDDKPELDIPYDLYQVQNSNFTNRQYNCWRETHISTDDIQIVIDCVETIDEAEYCLKKYKYEIVLLDYLLEEKNDKTRYGYELLEKIHKWHIDKKKRKKNNSSDEKRDSGDEELDRLYMPGPNNRFFIMFISAFQTAVHERMLEKGFARTERELWHIGNGACPTNTPYLFSHQLMQLMRHRIHDLKKDKEGGKMSIIDLLECIYVKTENGVQDIREDAYKYFNNLLFMREKYKKLENDLSRDDEWYMIDNPNDAKYLMGMKSSLLLWSAFKVVHHFSGAFFDHLQHLVYLTAFGTIRQWQEMWEEYVFVYKELCEYDKYVDDEGCEQKRGRKISDAIQQYIISLKEHND